MKAVHNGSRRRPSRGFTLVELMITVAIVGILGTVAYPSFMSQVRKSRRADAVDLAAKVLQVQERWRANEASYTTSFTSLSVASTSQDGYYTASLSNPSGTGYTITMTPVATKSQASDTGCTSLTVTVNRGSPTYAPAACWSR